jgi:hypothetical protein
LLLIYCEHITPRLEYIVTFMLHNLCGFEIRLITEETDYFNYGGATLNYSNRKLKAVDIDINPNGLLRQHTINHCEGIMKQEGEMVQLFLNTEGVDASTFDPFAAAFFLLTRYEEYLAFTPDFHNRFEASASLLYRHNLLHRPLINEWASALKHTIFKMYPNLPSRPNPFTYKLSIDVDQAFAFQHRGLLRNSLSFFRNLTQGNVAYLKRQLQTVLLRKIDPFDTFDYLLNLQQEQSFPAIYFINAGAYSKYDKNLPLQHEVFRKLLKKLNMQAEVGLHPSYYSDNKSENLVQEKGALEAVLNRSVTQSRQHYLKLNFPDTYRHLLKAGITEDYTMGYASQPGFRAGTCTPFYWFDLERGEMTSLKVFPITYMEGTFGEDLVSLPEAALVEMKKLIDTVRYYRGCLIPIWQNHTVNDLCFWKGWKAVFEESLHYIIKA